MSRQIEKLRADLVSWAGRPPGRSSAAAWRAVRAGITREPWLGLRTAAASAAVVALMVTALLSVPATRPEGDPGVVRSVKGGPHLAASLLVYELRSGTKLYLALTDKTTNGEDGK